MIIALDVSTATYDPAPPGNQIGLVASGQFIGPLLLSSGAALKDTA